MSLCIIDHVTGASCWEFVEVQVVEAQLSGADSITGNKDSGKNKNAYIC
jgi:hypothetical protein